MTAVRREVIGYDELGFACLAADCPQCGAVALIVNEWDAVECLSCSWREFEPPAPDTPAPAPASCTGCLGFLVITLADLAVMSYAAVQVKPVVVAGGTVLLWLIMVTARWYRGIK